MNDDLEKNLRQALRPVEPEEGFADRVLARVRAEQAPPTQRQLGSERFAGARRAFTFRNVAAALAASAVVAVVLVHSWQERQERRGLEARQQLIEALRVTGEKLDIAYRSVNSESRRSRPDDVGA